MILANDILSLTLELIMPFFFFFNFNASMKIFNEWYDSKPSVIPIYKKLIAAGLKIWVYRYILYTQFLFFFCFHPNQI